MPKESLNHAALTRSETEKKSVHCESWSTDLEGGEAKKYGGREEGWMEATKGGREGGREATT